MSDSFFFDIRRELLKFKHFVIFTFNFTKLAILRYQFQE